MKKLFVLFLLVVLVPFTVGCNLFGGDDDGPAAVNMTKLTASAVLPASAGKPSLRGAAVAANKFENVTMKIGNITLKAVTEELTDATNNLYTVTFEKIVNTADYQAATTGIVNVIITKNDSNTIKFAVDFSTLSPSSFSVEVDTSNNVKLPTGSTGTIYPEDKYAEIKSITETKNTLTPEFTIVFDKDIVSIDTTGNNAAFDIKVTSGTTTVAASKADFRVSYTPNTMKVSLENKELTDGKTYTVTINKLVNSNGLAIISTSYTFTVKLTQ